MKKLPVVLALAVVACAQQAPTITNAGAPAFRVDAAWPKPLPEESGVQLVLGQVAGVAVDERTGHVWIVHRPSTLLADEWDAKAARPVTHRCCKSAPPVVEFDAAGNYLRGWGPSDARAQWPKSEHGIYIDPDGNVWIAGNGDEDNQILKFTPEGKFLMQIGHAGKSEGSSSRTQLGRPAHMVLDPKANELYVADGYGNHRVIVFDARTGEYKRHWGAYGGAPSDEKQAAYDPAGAPARQFGNPVHCVRLSNDRAYTFAIA
jgi:DNA-binding beta-propeller fold protein YncE